MHHDEAFARAAGQPSVFAMGQLTAAILGSTVAGWLGRENVAAYGVRFKGKVWPGDRLLLTGEPAELEDGLQRYELRAVREGDGAVVITGWATART
jgi:acyl dehydratase